MSIATELYKKLIVSDIKNTEEEPDVGAWYAFLDSLPEPADCFEEAYNKYRCRLQYVPEGKTRFLNFASFFVLASALPRIRGKHEPLPPLQGNTLMPEAREDVHYSDVLPPELPGKYDGMKIVKQTAARYGDLSSEALELYNTVVRRYPGEYHFHLWVLKELSNHSRYIRLYNPAATAVYVNERNIAGPILTYLYEISGRKLISFMHGDYLLQMIQAYMDFSEYYVWNEEYIDMFRNDLRCRIRNYFITTPGKLTKKWNLENVEPDHYCTYYFSGESTASVRKLAVVFREMEKKGKKCLVRPHPRYSHLDLIEECFEPSMIEYPREVSMEESLGRTKYVVGLHTTVLSEAQVEGRTAVIDDISDPEQFMNLEKRKFVVLRKEHKLLSEIV